MNSESLWCAIFMGKVVTFIFQKRKLMHREIHKFVLGINGRIGVVLNSVGLKSMCSSSFPFFLFVLYQVALSELWSSMKQQLQSYLSILSKDTFDHNYPWQNSPFYYKLLLWVCLWSKLGGICSEDMEGELMETAHKSSTFGNAIIYRLAYFRSAQFWFH